jgi:Flp pilus assembly protein CpaB
LLKGPRNSTAIRVTKEQVVGDLPLPGRRVDVLRQRNDGGADGKTTPVVEDVLVLAVDVLSERIWDVTFVATPDQVSAVAAAQRKGKLMVRLCGAEASPRQQGRSPK